MTYPCSGCGLHSCDGIECYQESSPDAVEFAANMKRLREKYGEELIALRDADVSGDPLLEKRGRKAA